MYEYEYVAMYENSYSLYSCIQVLRYDVWLMITIIFLFYIRVRTLACDNMYIIPYPVLSDLSSALLANALRELSDY